MSEPPDGAGKSKLLDQLVGIAREYQASLPQLVATSNQANMAKQLAYTTKRAEAQADAKIKECVPGYVPPERDEEEVSTLLNGVFIGTDEINKIIDADNQPTPAPLPDNGFGRPRLWWLRWLLSLLVAALLTFLITWLAIRYLSQPPGTYSIIAVPYQPPNS